MGNWNLLGGLMPPEVDTAEERERRHFVDLGTEEEFEALDQEISYDAESKDEDSYDIVPRNLTFAEIINILNQALEEDNYEKLDEIIQNIEGYEGRSITLDHANLRNFCEQQLSLDLQNNQHIYSNILSRYNFDHENFECGFSVKELLLIAVAANDKLVEKYQDTLFAEENLNLLPLLVGDQKYIEVFIEKFHGVYDKLKSQAIQLGEFNKIGFFSAIALRKEQELLETILVEHVLRDLEHVLKISDPDPLYGVLETASLAKNEKFIAIVLNAFENEPTKKELLKASFVTLLETAISQEHISVIEYLCKRYINNRDCTIYEQAFADDKVIKMLNQQILKKIEARNNKKIYDLVLKTALNAGNITFIERLCEERARCSNDVIVYLNQKLKDNELDNTSVRQIIKNILKNAIHYSTDQEDYSLVKEVCYLCSESDEINAIFQEECEIFKSSIKERIEDLEKQEKLLQSEALHEYNYNYLPSVVNGLAQVVHAGYDIYTENQELTKCQENPILNRLMHIRNILQFPIDVREYSCHERQGLWDQMYNTPGTFMVQKRSDDIADRSAIPAIESDVLSGNSESQSTDSEQQQGGVDERMNIAEQEVEVVASSQVVNEENNSQLSSQEFRSTGSQQPQGNMNELENIINEATRDEQEVETETQEQEGEGRAVRVVKYGIYSSIAMYALALASRLLPAPVCISAPVARQRTSLSQVDNNSAPFAHHVPQVMLESKVNEYSKTLDNSLKSAKNNFGIPEDYPKPKWYKDLHKSETSDAEVSVATLNKKVLKGTISNNYRRGKMPKNIKTIEEKLSNAIDSINLTGLIHLLKKLDASVYESNLQKLFGQANDKIANLEEGEQKETLGRIIVFLEKELEHTAAESLVSDNVEIATSSQEVPVVESKESSSSLSSEEDDYSRLESDKSAGSSPSFEVIDDIAETSITIVPEMAEFESAETPSIVTERAEAELGNTDDMSFSLLDSVDENPRSNEGAAVHDDQRGTGLFSSDNSSARGYLGSTPSLRRSSISEDSYYSFSSDVDSGQLTRAHSDSSILDTFGVLDRNSNSSSQSSLSDLTFVDTQVAENTEQMANEDAQATIDASVLAGAAAGVLGAAGGIYKASKHNAPSPLGVTEEHIPEGQSNFDGNNDSKNSDQIPPTHNTSGGRADGDEEEQRSAGRKEQMANENTHPKPTLPITSEQGGNSNKSDRNVVLQNTKVATWIFAITGMLVMAAAPAAYFALGASLLVAGAVAGIGAFCIVAAIAIHYNKSPSDSLAKPSAEAAIVNNVAIDIS